MIKTFREYARNIGAALAIVSLPFTGCRNVPVQEEPTKPPIESPAIPQEYQKHDSEGIIVEDFRVHLNEDGSLYGTTTIKYEYGEHGGTSKIITERDLDGSHSVDTEEFIYNNNLKLSKNIRIYDTGSEGDKTHTINIDEYVYDNANRVARETNKHDYVESSGETHSVVVTEYVYPSKFDDGRKFNRDVYKKDENGDGKFEWTMETEYDRRHVRTKATRNTDSNQNNVPEETKIEEYRKGELLRATRKYDDNEDGVFDREEIIEDNSEEMSFQDFLPRDPKYTRIAERIRNYIAETTADFPFMEVELPSGKIAVMMSITNSENQEDNGLYITLYKPGENPKVRQLVNTLFYEMATLCDINFDGLITPDEIIVDEATLQRRHGGRVVGIRWDHLAAVRQTDSYRTVLDEAEKLIDEETRESK